MSLLNDIPKFNADMSYREEVLTKITAQIELKFGREKPTICKYQEYESNKDEINNIVLSKKHVSESDWEGCDKILLEFVKFSSDKMLETISSDSEENGESSCFRHTKVDSWKLSNVKTKNST